MLLWIILGVAAVILALIFLPNINVCFKFNSDGTAKIYLRYLFLKLTVYPGKEERKADAGKKKSAKKKKSSELEKLGAQKKETVKRGVDYYLELIKLIMGRIIEFFPKYLKLKIYDLTVNAGGGDASKTALTFGGISAATDIFIVFLRNSFNVKYESIHVKADFMAEKTTFNINLRLYIRIISVVILGMSILGGKSKTDKTYDENKKSNQK